MIDNRQRGFTLIELVVVITILGILAAFAIPRFITLDTSARTATINGLAGSVKSAAALARGMAMVSQSTTSVQMEGASVSLANYYPDGTATGIANAVNSNNGASADFLFTAGTSAANATWQKVGAPTQTACVVNYLQAASGATPTVGVVTTGC